jgi:hypothetical protein
LEISAILFVGIMARTEEHLHGVVSKGRSTQAEGYRPDQARPGLVINTYAFPIRKVVVRREEISRFFDYIRLCTTYKWAAVEALGVTRY